MALDFRRNEISAASSPRTIAIIDPLGSHGGHHYYVHNQANSLAALGNRIFVYGPTGDSLDNERYTRIESFSEIYSRQSKVVRGLRLASQLTRATWQAWRAGAQYNVFHIFRADVLELYPIILSWLLRIRATCFIHDVERLDADIGSNFLAPIARLSSNLVSHNQFSREALLRRLGGSADIAVVPHGNYVQDFPHPPSKAEARAHLHLEPDSQVLLFFGNFRKTKGAEVLLDALAKHRDASKLVVVVAGKMKGPDEGRLRSRIAELGIEKIMDLRLGHVPDDMIAHYFCASDFVLLPYLLIFESGVGLMSMSLGRPIIASDLPPLREIVGQNERGLLFEAENSAALSSAIGAALEGSQLADRLAAKAKAYALEERDWAISARLLDELLSASRESAGPDQSVPAAASRR